MTPRHFPPFHLERWFAEFEFTPGMRNLAASCPFTVTTRELLELEDAETTARYLSLNLDYIENPGSESLRHAVAQLHTTLKADDVRMMTGANEALLLLIWTTVAPGDNIVVEEPCYDTVPGVAQALGIEVRKLPLRQEDGRVRRARERNARGQLHCLSSVSLWERGERSPHCALRQVRSVPR